MADVERTHARTAGVVLVAIPGDARAASVARALAAERLMPVTVFTRDALVAFARDGPVSAVVVDPAIDGLHNGNGTMLDAVRAATAAPIVVIGFVSGAGADALGTGADALLGVDASPADVVGTVLTAIAHGGGPAGVVTCADLVVDLRNFEAWRGAQRLALTPTELRILAALVAGRGDVVTKHELQTAAWGTAGTHEDNRLQAHMRRLRSKLDAAPGDAAPGDAAPGNTNGTCRVLTVRGIGFRLDVSRASVHEPTGIGVEPSGARR
jgi:DNA-binding response OmpR family regulator